VTPPLDVQSADAGAALTTPEATVANNIPAMRLRITLQA
jgi:hypothetical protein